MSETPEDADVRMVAESFLIPGAHPNLKLVAEAALESVALRTQLQQAEQERDAARAELKFYGDPATYKGLIADNANLESQLQQAETALRAALALDDALTAALDAGPDRNAATNAATQAFRDAMHVYRAALAAPPPNPKEDDE